jgi:hypothetical protein
VNAPASVAESPESFVTVTSTAPATWAGVVAWRCDELTYVVVAAMPSNETWVDHPNRAPKTSTSVPPADGPDVGATCAIVGGPRKPSWETASAPSSGTLHAATEKTARNQGVTLRIGVALGMGDLRAIPQQRPCRTRRDAATRS